MWARPRVVGSYPEEGPLLLSGYLEGRGGHCRGEAPAVEVAYGEGRLVLVGFSLHNRAQMVANFKLLFNAIAGQGDYRAGQDGMLRTDPTPEECGETRRDLMGDSRSGLEHWGRIRSDFKFKSRITKV